MGASHAAGHRIPLHRWMPPEAPSLSGMQQIYSISVLTSRLAGQYYRDAQVVLGKGIFRRPRMLFSPSTFVLFDENVCPA
jgi:hypothetical protein